MKKLSYISIAFAALTAFASCSKDMDAPEQNIAPAGAPRTFEVSSPETKTTLDGLHVNWAAGDEIRVYGHNTSTDTYTDNAVYELTSGAGSGTGTFTLKAGETGLNGTYDEYYAIYPAGLEANVSSTKIVFPRLNIAGFNIKGQSPAPGQCDPNLALMTAAYDGSRLVFRHGVAYVKLTIPDDGVTRVKIDFTNNCTAETPSYSPSTGAIVEAKNSANYIQSSSEMSFVKGETYYFAAIPRPGYTPTETIITLTGGDTYRTTHFTAALEAGKVYNLGMPNKGPGVAASDVNIESGDTAGSIGFTVSNLKDGGVVTSEVLTGATIASLSLGAVSFNTSTGEGSVSFTCDANTDTENAKTATVRLTYTYDTDKTATKDVTITQKKKGAVAINYSWVFSSSAFSAANAAATTVLSSTASASSNTSITWDYIGTDLTFIANKSTYNGTYIQTGGSGSDSSRCFSFVAPAAGTLTLSISSNGSSSRNITVTLAGEAVTATSGGSVNTTAATSHVYNLAAGGNVVIYSSDGQLRFYSIAYSNE